MEDQLTIPDEEQCATTGADNVMCEEYAETGVVEITEDYLHDPGKTTRVVSDTSVADLGIEQDDGQPGDQK